MYLEILFAPHCCPPPHFSSREPFILVYCHWAWAAYISHVKCRGTWTTNLRIKIQNTCLYKLRFLEQNVQSLFRHHSPLTNVKQHGSFTTTKPEQKPSCSKKVAVGRYTRIMQNEICRQCCYLVSEMFFGWRWVEHKRTYSCSLWYVPLLKFILKCVQNTSLKQMF